MLTRDEFERVRTKIRGILWGVLVAGRRSRNEWHFGIEEAEAELEQVLSFLDKRCVEGKSNERKESGAGPGVADSGQGNGAVKPAGTGAAPARGGVSSQPVPPK